MPQSGTLPARPRQSAIVYPTPAALSQDPGPASSMAYAVVLSLGPTVFSWALYDETDADDVNVIAPTGGSPGRWKRARFVERGDDLADASATILVSGGRHRVIPPDTITAPRTLTLGTTGAVAGDKLLITRNDSAAHAVTLANGGTNAGTVAVMPAGARAWCLAVFDGTDWIHKASALSLATS